MKRRSVNTVEAKNRLNELIAEVNRSKEPVVVEKRGKPVAVVLDYETFIQGRRGEKRGERETLLKELNNFHKRMRKKYPQGTGDSVEILREIRLQRAARL